MPTRDHSLLYEAIRLAEEAGQRGNLPIGAVIVLNNEIVSTGMNAIWVPVLDLTRHAEMEALRSLPSELRAKCKEMTLYTTLEPCVMCAGAILLHQLGRLVYGSTDPFGGVSTCRDTLPPYFKHALSMMQWIGPALPSECDPLYQHIKQLEKIREQIC